MKYKIVIYAIAKNEEKFVEKFMESAREADAVIIGDTGSTDATADKFKALGATVHHLVISPWRFDKARQELLDLLPQDADICISLDIDESLQPGWREKLEKVWQPSTHQVTYSYIWSVNPDGTPNILIPYSKIHARHGFRWKYPVHEILEFTGPGKPNIVEAKEIVIHHQPDLNKARSSYLPLLELAAEENPKDARMIGCLGREYASLGRYEEAIETLKKSLALPSPDKVERSDLMRLVSDCLAALDRTAEAKEWLLKATRELPDSREPYLALMLFCKKNEDWRTLVDAASKAVTIKKNRYPHAVSDPRAWNQEFYVLAAIACYHLRLYDKARSFLRSGLEMLKDEKSQTLLNTLIRQLPN